jgi:hypothetical protein
MKQGAAKKNLRFIMFYVLKHKIGSLADESVTTILLHCNTLLLMYHLFTPCDAVLAPVYLELKKGS